MKIKNLDYACYRDAVMKQRRHQEDWLRNGYAPRGYYLKDFCLIQQNENWHLFHIAGTPGVSCCLPGNEIWFGHAKTRDFQSWETLEPCFYIQPGAWDNGHVFAPYVVEKEGEFWMFYTGCSIDNTQRIGAARSTDLHHWQRVSDRPVIRPEEYGWAFCPTKRGAACRDPHVCWWGESYSLYYTAVTREGRGCIARAESIDLIHWQDRGPVYVYKDLTHCESANVQEHEGQYMLFFGGHLPHWSYVVSDNPWQWPEQEPRTLCKGVTGMEVIRKQNQRWLVAYFKLDCYRLFLGVVDWSEQKPEIEEIHTPEKLNFIADLNMKRK